MTEIYIQLTDSCWYSANMDDAGKWYAINFYGGYFECSPKLIARQVEAEGWHDIYKRFGYNPIAIADEDEDSGYHPDLWVSPDGHLYDGEGHCTAAMDIVEVLYGRIDINNPEPFLEERGWLKLSSFSHELRVKEGELWRITARQRDRMQKWCEIWDRTFPTNIILVGAAPAN